MHGNDTKVRAGALAAAVALGAAAHGHVGLDAPNGGESLEVGAHFDIEWHVVIEHNLENWDLWYSTTSASGPWIEIAVDLPPGDGAVGSMHHFDWVVPDDVAESAWVRVRQDNAGMDYDDVSDAPFEIVGGGCAADLDASGAVDFVDLLAVLAAWGPCADCPEDLDGDGAVGFLDLLALLTAWGPCA